jgi:hypothetical protein
MYASEQGWETIPAAISIELSGSLGESIQGSFGFLCQLSLRRTVSQLEQQLVGFWRAQVASVDGTGARNARFPVISELSWESARTRSNSGFAARG